MTATDHRRAVADRNRAAILDAVEELLVQRQPLNMAAVAAAAGVSRPTLYAHFKTLGDVLEATAERVVLDSVAALEAAMPDEGPAPDAVKRMLGASWQRLAAVEPLVDAAAGHLPPDHVQRTHAPVMKLTLSVIERGQREGAFRSDLPAEWLVRAYYALIHAADEMARGRGPSRKRTLAMLEASVLDLLQGRSN